MFTDIKSPRCTTIWKIYWIGIIILVFLYRDSKSYCYQFHRRVLYSKIDTITNWNFFSIEIESKPNLFMSRYTLLYVYSIYISLLILKAIWYATAGSGLETNLTSLLLALYCTLRALPKWLPIMPSHVVLYLSPITKKCHKKESKKLVFFPPSKSIIICMHVQ